MVVVYLLKAILKNASRFKLFYSEVITRMWWSSIFLTVSILNLHKITGFNNFVPIIDLPLQSKTVWSREHFSYGLKKVNSLLVSTEHNWCDSWYNSKRKNNLCYVCEVIISCIHLRYFINPHIQSIYGIFLILTYKVSSPLCFVLFLIPESVSSVPWFLAKLLILHSIFLPQYCKRSTNRERYCFY